MKAELLAERPCVLGESPRWDDHAAILRWIDIELGELLSVDLDGGDLQVRRVGAPCGALVLDRSGAPAVAIGTRWHRVDDGPSRPFSSLDDDDVRFNDAGVDSLGRIWSGTMRVDDDLGPPAVGTLYCIDSATPRAVVGGFLAANGIAWSPDEKLIYCVDSGANTVLRAAFDLERGLVGEFRAWVEVVQGMADGITVDSEGGVWLARWGTGTIVRYGASGSPTHTVTVPTPNVTAVAFAGPDLSRLVITTARLETHDDELAGSVFVTDAPVAGLPLHRSATLFEREGR